MTPEGKVKARVKRLLAAHGVYYFMPPANGYGRAGIPDVVACVNGMFLSVECKAAGGMFTPLQVREGQLIRAAGGVWICIRGEDGIDKLEAVVKLLKAAEKAGPVV